MRKPRNISYIVSLAKKAQINFDSTDRGVIGGWNNWILTSKSLNDPGGSATGWALEYISGSYDAEDEGVQTDPDGIFPSAVLKYMVNTSGGDIVTRFSGLNAAKIYKITPAAVQSYTDPGDKTDVILNGTRYNLGGPSDANVVYKITATVTNPPGGIINMTFTTTAGASYKCMNAMIIEEM